MSQPIDPQISANNRAFEAAVAARDLAALAACYTAAARILPPGNETVAGRDNIRQFWQGAIEALNVASVELHTVDFEAAGDTAYEIGRATLHFGAAGVPSGHAKYVVIWKQEDGAWKWHVDIWNPNA